VFRTCRPSPFSRDAQTIALSRDLSGERAAARLTATDLVDEGRRGGDFLFSRHSSRLSLFDTSISLEKRDVVDTSVFPRARSLMRGKRKTRRVRAQLKPATTSSCTSKLARRSNGVEKGAGEG